MGSLSVGTVTVPYIPDYLARRSLADGHCGRPPMRNDLLKSLYATMLQRFTPEQVIEFWRHLPLATAGTASLGDLLRHIWNADGVSSKEYVGRALCCVEPFLVGQGHDVPEFLESLAFRINKGTPVPGRTLIAWMQPVLKTIFFATDLRYKVLQLMAFTSDKFIPGSHREVLRLERKGGFTTAWCLFAPDRNLSVQWAYHSELIGLKMMANAPRVLGLPAFEDIRSLCDTGMLEHILWGDTLSIEDGRILINGKVHGEVIPFRSYCARLGFDLSHLDAPDWPVHLIHEALHCPLRKREVLHAGCAYGAPVWIAQVRYPTRAEDQDQALQHVIGDMEDTWGEELENRHARLLESLAAKAEFTYFKRDGVMLLNGNTLIRGVPAELLAYMLKSFRESGKTEFLLSEFKRDTDILKRRQPNLEAFLEKLRERLETRSDKVRIKVAKGLRLLEADCPVRFEEK